MEGCCLLGRNTAIYGSDTAVYGQHAAVYGGDADADGGWQGALVRRFMQREEQKHAPPYPLCLSAVLPPQPVDDGGPLPSFRQLIDRSAGQSGRVRGRARGGEQALRPAARPQLPRRQGSVTDSARTQPPRMPALSTHTGLPSLPSPPFPSLLPAPYSLLPALSSSRPLLPAPC
eukprot:3275522-Rhodomonas_salina.2